MNITVKLLPFGKIQINNKISGLIFFFFLWKFLSYLLLNLRKLSITNLDIISYGF